MPENLQHRMAKGAVWMVLFKLVERSLGLVSTLILARLLVPADFGVVAMALSFIVMGEMLTSFGFEVALIQNQNASIDHYNTAWTGNFLLGLSVTTLMLLLAEPIAGFYRKPEVFWVVSALAFGPLLSGCENIGVVAFRKELNFRREFVFQLSRKLIAFAVVVPLAFLMRSYWALVAGMLASKLAGTSISYLMHPFRPRFTLSKLKEMIQFSRWMLLINVVSFFRARSADFFIGRLHGAAPLGVYNISYELASLPSTELSAPINRALLPGFARMITPEEVRTAYANTIAMLALLALPAAAGMFAVAPYLVPVVLGAKWLDTIPLVEVLAFNGALILFQSSISTVLIGRGFPGRVMLTNAIYVLMLLVLLGLLAGQFGAMGAAYATLVSSILCTPIYLDQMRRCLKIGPVAFARAILRPLIASLSMAAVVRWVLPAIEPTTTLTMTAAWLASGIALGVLTYFALITALWHAVGRPGGPERAFLDRARSVLARRLARCHTRSPV